MKHAICSSTQAHASAVSAAQDLASLRAVQGSAGAVQSQGAQLVPAGQAGQTHTGGGGALVAGALVAVPLAFPVPVLLLPTVMVVVEAAPQLQLHGAHAAPAGQLGQLQVHVPLPVVAPVPVPVVVPQLAPVPPPAPPVPVPPPAPRPVPQSHLQGGQASPATQAGQAQVQVPPPALAPPSSRGGGGGQSHATGGQEPSLGHASGWTQPQPLPAAGACQQYPLPVQSWPTGHSAGAVAVPAMTVQAQRESAPQVFASAYVAHGSTVAQTAAGQSALAGQASAVQAHAGPAFLHV